MDDQVDYKQLYEQYRTWVPPGHFYSPIHSKNEVSANETRIFDKKLRDLGGIDLNVKGQLAMLKKLRSNYSKVPFEALKNEKFRYFFENPAFSYTDGIVLFLMILTLSPKSIIEVGSGYSCCVMLDANEMFFNNKIDLLFIEPYPELLQSLAKNGD